MRQFCLITILVMLNIAFFERAMAAAILTDSDGAVLNLTTAAGATQNIKDGDEVADGSSLKLASNQSATLSFDTGMEVVVAPGSQIKIESDDDQTPLLNLIAGELRSFLSPTEPKEAKPKLRVVTPTAVVGVRGTDFVVAATGGNTDVHTLEGSVEVAPSRADLKAGKNILAINQGEGVEGHQKGAAFAKRTFNREQFISQFHRRHPRLALLRQRAETRRQQFRRAIMRRKIGNKVGVGARANNMGDEKKIETRRERRQYRRRKRQNDSQ